MGTGEKFSMFYWQKLLTKLSLKKFLSEIVWSCYNKAFQQKTNAWKRQAFHHCYTLLYQRFLWNVWVVEMTFAVIQKPSWNNMLKNVVKLAICFLCRVQQLGCTWWHSQRCQSLVHICCSSGSLHCPPQHIDPGDARSRERPGVH